MLDLQIGRDFSVSSLGGLWTDEGLARLKEAGAIRSAMDAPPVYRMLQGEAFDAYTSAVRAARGEVAVFEPTPAFALSIQEGVHFQSSGASPDWLSEGQEALRRAGWDGRYATMPYVDEVLASRPSSSTPTAACPPVPKQPTAAPVAARPIVPAAATDRPAIISRVPVSTKTAPQLDHRRIMARSQHGDAGFAAMERAGASETMPPVKARTMQDLATQFWARRSAAAASRPAGARSGRPSQAIDAGAIFDRLARYENRLPDAVDIYRRRRQA